MDEDSKVFDNKHFISFKKATENFEKISLSKFCQLTGGTENLSKKKIPETSKNFFQKIHFFSRCTNKLNADIKLLITEMKRRFK